MALSKGMAVDSLNRVTLIGSPSWARITRGERRRATRRVWRRIMYFFYKGTQDMDLGENDCPLLLLKRTIFKFGWTVQWPLSHCTNSMALVLGTKTVFSGVGERIIPNFLVAVLSKET